jgi:two-component system, NarL family, response regulator LiaR
MKARLTFDQTGNMKRLLLYGLVLGVLTVLLKWLEFRFLILSHAFEIYAGIIAVLFTVVGIWAGRKLTTPKIEKEVVYVEKAAPANPGFVFNQAEAEKRGISAREMEVLGLIAEGLSNQEIADRLFVSLNTVKTHTSNLFLKLEVTRRTMAVQKAKSLGLLA